MNKVLFLPGMGIQPMEYNSVKASSEAQLLAFNPGPQYVGLEGWYPNALSSMVWNGSAWIPRVPVVETLPADASTHGKRVQYYKYPVVASLPATVVNDARYVLDATKVEYLGRSVVELNSTDDFVNYPIPSEITNGSSFAITSKDLNTDPSATILYSLNNGLSDRFLQITYQDHAVNAYYRDSDGDIHVTDEISITANELNTVELYFDDDRMYLSCGENVVSIPVDLSKKREYNESGTYFFEPSALPFQICCIQQSLNGILIDNIPCDESTGTTLRNTVSPDRPATLSDATAHALAWVAQSAPTLTVWMWKGVFRNEGEDFVDCGSLPWVQPMLDVNGEFTARVLFISKTTDQYKKVFIGGARLSLAKHWVSIALRTNASIWGTSEYEGYAESEANAMVADRVFDITTAHRSSGTTLRVNGIPYFNNDTTLIPCNDPTLTIGGFYQGAENFEGDIAFVEFYSGANLTGTIDGLTLIDRYDFDKWDGTGSGVSEKGFPFTVTDGTPFTAKSFTWVPT